MAIQVQNALEHMRQTLMSGDIPPELGGGLHLLNQAGEHLYSMHPWRFAQGRSSLLNLRGTVSGTAGTFNGTDTLTDTGKFTNYTFVDGDEIEIVDGTGVTTGFYPVTARVSANALTIPDIGASASDVSYILQPYSIDLPDDCREVIAVVGTGNNTKGITLSSLEEVLRAREDEVTSSFHFYGSFAYSGTPPTPILEIGPGAGSNETGAFRLFYRSRWTRLTADSSVIQIPEYVEMLFLQIARAVARGYVREDTGSLDARLAEIQAGPIFHAAKKSDGALQLYYGKIRGGGMSVFAQRRPGSDFNEIFDRVNGPL